jgi:hypothetical protein
MIKKKKKLSYSEQLKQQKLQETQYRNLFIQKMRNVCAAIGDPKLYDLIPHRELAYIYMLRSAPLKVIAAKGAKIQKRLLEVIETQIKKSVGKATIEMIPGSGRSIPLTDYILAGTILEAVLRSSKTSIREPERFAEFVAHKEERSYFYVNTVRDVCESACQLYNDISAHKGFYTFDFDLSYGSEAKIEQIDALTEISSKPEGKAKGAQMWREMDKRMHPIVSIFLQPLDVKNVLLDGEMRPAIQLGIMVYEKDYVPCMVQVPLKLSLLDGSKAPNDQTLPVYIQQHALHRLMERTGCIIPSYMTTYLHLAVLAPAITKLSESKFLIEFRFEDLRIGYLLCERMPDMVLIRTFLFITHNGTPEGDKLAAITKLQKEDCKYLHIDNLRSLLGSDILGNEALCNLFREAGCQSILDLCSKVKDNESTKVLLGVTEQKTSLSELMMEYLNPLADNNEYVIGE